MGVVGDRVAIFSGTGGRNSHVEQIMEIQNGTKDLRIHPEELLE